jgi:hypothetical protein
VSGGLTPRAEETLVRLSTWMPCAQAQELLEDLVGIQVSKATARRAMLATGEAALAVCEGEVERLKQEVPQAPSGADKQLLSADGAMGQACAGVDRTSIPCWCSGTRSAIGSGTRHGGHRWPSDRPFAHVGGKRTASSS